MAIAIIISWYYVQPDQLNGYCSMCKNQMASHKRAKSKAVANKDVIKSCRAMARAIREQAAATTLMTQQMANGNGHGHGNKHKDEYVRFAEFHKANLPSFRGVYDPNAADEWIKEIEKIFFILTYTEE